MSPLIVITHAAFDERRHQPLMRLTSDLRLEAPQLPFVIVKDELRQGSLWCWREAMERALRLGGNVTKASHIVWLPDDALICKDFGKLLLACIQARPNDVFDCYVNHPLFRTHTVSTCWYSTSDGYTGMGGVMPRALLEEHLRWRDARPELDAIKYPNDAGVNLWAADTGRLIYKTSWSLVQHDDKLSSLDGHDVQKREGHERVGLRPIAEGMNGIRSDVMNFLGRTWMAPEEHMPGIASEATHLGRTYDSNVFDLVRRLKPDHWNIDAMYQAYEPLGDKPKVVIIVPTYQEGANVIMATQPSREAVQEDLETHGIECEIFTPPGDSHVDRMRQRATHAALKRGATHLLWWDADIECLDPKTVRRMLISGHDIVAGACPFKNTKRRVVCNLWPRDIERLKNSEGLTTLPGGFVEVMHAGSGFMLMSRNAIIRLMSAHPERCHLSRSPGDFMEPLWAIWDAQVAGAEDDVWDRMFLTEDWNICRLWQELGGKVYIHAPSTFRHHGLFGYEASFAESFGLET